VRHINVVNDHEVQAIVRRCYSDVDVRDRTGKVGRGFTNLKRIFGWPAELRTVVEALARTIGAGSAVASADSGSAPLAALVAQELYLPAVFVRSEAKNYFLSYGDDPATNEPRLSGDRLTEQTVVHVIDDFVHSGATLTSAVRTLRRVGLRVETAAALLGSSPEALDGAIGELGVHLTLFATTIDPEPLERVQRE
jgi:adenine/guanine phosphoribosyltransferase-like PRPP-binding protein